MTVAVAGVPSNLEAIIRNVRTPGLRLIGALLLMITRYASGPLLLLPTAPFPHVGESSLASPQPPPSSPRSTLHLSEHAYLSSASCHHWHRPTRHMIHGWSCFHSSSLLAHSPVRLSLHASMHASPPHHSAPPPDRSRPAACATPVSPLSFPCCRAYSPSVYILSFPPASMHVFMHTPRHIAISPRCFSVDAIHSSLLLSVQSPAPPYMHACLPLWQLPLHARLPPLTLLRYYSPTRCPPP